MGFDVLSYVLGLQAGKGSGGGGSSEKVLLAEQTIEGFETNASYQGAFTKAIQPSPFSITVGEEYIVEWDGTEYKVTGQDTSSLLNGTVSIGNGKGFGFSGNNEPFFLIDWGSYMTFVAVDTETSHKVKIYQEASSSGGGSLPAGLYWEQANMVFPSGISQFYYFTFANKLHCMGLTSTAETYNLYEINGNEFIEKATGLYILNVGSGPMEYNGKIHFLGGGGYTQHFVYDGTTLTKLNDVNYGAAKTDFFVYDGKLMYFYQNKFWEWNEASDTWTRSTTISKPSDVIVAKAFEANGEIYLLDYSNNKLFKYISGTFVEVGQFVNKYAYNLFTHIDGFVYHLYSSSGSAINVYKLDCATYEDVLIGQVPHLPTGAAAYSWEGKLHLTANKMNMIMHNLA